jgi:uncharacterized protein YggE
MRCSGRRFLTPNQTMRRTLLILLVLPAVAVAQTTPRDSVIAATASKTARILPDRASMYIIVEGSAETPADAVARGDTKVKSVTDALKRLGAGVEVDRPVGYTLSLAPVNQGYPSAPMSTSYVTRSVIRVQTNRTDQTSAVVAAAIGAGASSMSSLTFESSVADSVRRARIAEAITAAKLDAETIAGSLGGRLGALVDVSSSGNFGFQGPNQLIFDSRFGNGSSPTPEVVLNITVTVHYRLIR